MLETGGRPNDKSASDACVDPGLETRISRKIDLEFRIAPLPVLIPKSASPD
jgi:hypothetical protein